VAFTSNVFGQATGGSLRSLLRSMLRCTHDGLYICKKFGIILYGMGVACIKISSWSQLAPYLTDNDLKPSGPCTY